jgi:hypothetical protein
MGKKRPKRQPKKLNVDIVETQAIVLVDEFGTERASLSCSGGDGGAGGHTVVHLHDDEGRPRITLQVDDQGNPSMCLFNCSNSPGVSMAANGDRGNGLKICDADGKSVIMLGIPGPESDDPRGPKPDITVFDEQGGTQWTVSDGACELPKTQNDVEADNAKQTKLT